MNEGLFLAKTVLLYFHSFCFCLFVSSLRHKVVGFIMEFLQIFAFIYPVLYPSPVNYVAFQFPCRPPSVLMSNMFTNLSYLRSTLHILWFLFYFHSLQILTDTCVYISSNLVLHLREDMIFAILYLNTLFDVIISNSVHISSNFSFCCS